TPIQRIISLKNADATEAASQVKLFFGTPTYNEIPQKDAQGNVIGTSRTLADVKIDSPTLRVVADVRSNSVIVRGTNKEVAEVSR
ncbi:secretin N-terminal domain-containing protein, partial [Micrococcus sp. SIMBA_131]